MAGPDNITTANATGTAAKLVARHADEHPLKLYGAWFCPYVQRTWIVLEEKKIPYQWIETNPYKREPWFVKLNPRCLVPILVVPPDAAAGEERMPLIESAIIDEYLDDAYADEAKYGTRLLPVEPYERARARVWIDHVNTRIVPAWYRFLQHTPEKAYTIDEAREALHGHIKLLVKAMSKHKGPWFAGESISLVDISLAPFSQRFYLGDHYKAGGLQIPKPGQGGDDGAVWDRWAKWDEAVRQRRSVVETMSATEEYVRIYQRYANDTSQSQVARAVREGRPMP